MAISDKDRAMLFAVVKTMRHAEMAMGAIESAVRGPEQPGGSLRKSLLGSALEELAAAREVLEAMSMRLR